MKLIDEFALAYIQGNLAAGENGNPKLAYEFAKACMLERKNHISDGHYFNREATGAADPRAPDSNSRRARITSQLLKEQEERDRNIDEQWMKEGSQ
jgi:hypothetical protein